MLPHKYYLMCKSMATLKYELLWWLHFWWKAGVLITSVVPHWILNDNFNICLRKKHGIQETIQVTWWHVTIDEFLIYDPIYCTFWYTACQHFTFHCYTYTSVHSLLPLLGSGLKRWTVPSLWVPELSPASATSNSSQKQNCSSSITAITSKSKSKLCYDWRSVCQSSLAASL
jgi:hypothetical protein